MPVSAASVVDAVARLFLVRRFTELFQVTAVCMPVSNYLVDIVLVERLSQKYVSTL